MADGRNDGALVPFAASTCNDDGAGKNSKNNTSSNLFDYTAKKKDKTAISTPEAPITFLIEIAGITLPPVDKSSPTKWMDLGDNTTLNARGMHCTACWVDKRRKAKPKATVNNRRAGSPVAEDGMSRKETILHRTKTMAVDGSKVTDAETSSNSSDKSSLVDEEVENREHILTVNDSSLFLFKTSMKQLVEVSPSSISPQTSASKSSQVAPSSGKHQQSKSEADHTSISIDRNCGGIRFDLFEKPIDAFSSMYRSVLAETTREKEDNAAELDSFSYSSRKLSLANYNCYRLVGSVFLCPEEILGKCNEERFECDLYNGLRKEQRCFKTGKKQTEHLITLRGGNGGKLALRIRKASDFDTIFIQTLNVCDITQTPITVEMLNQAVRQYDPNRQPLKPASILTDCNEQQIAADASLRALGNLSPQAYESVRFMFSDEKERRVFVKPYADPTRVEETMWFTEEQLHRECWKESTNWVKAGSGTLGKVYVEILQCRGLPNVDTGPGNKTDPFVSIVYGDVMVQTDVIDDSLAPMWMPWSKRAFVFDMDHPSTALYIGVVDYDVGPLEHECIGRAAVQLNKFMPGMLYTLSYKLYETSNLTDRGDDAGVITLRLRLEYDEKRYLQEGLKTPSPQFVNSKQWKSHRVAKYTVDGPHDDDVFEMRVFRSHINEILTAKRTLSYIFSDAFNSIIFWRAQVKVGSAWLPLHSAIVFYFSVCVVERPQLLPSYLCFACGWIMMANMFQREHNPNPWKHGKSFSYYWNLLLHGRSMYVPRKIQPLDGHKETVKYEKLWQDRLDEDDARWVKQAELDAKVKDISDESIIRTKAKANAPLADPLSNLAGSWLLPYQQRLGGYCKKIRWIRNVLNWTESVVAFWWTLVFFGCGAAALFVPWAFLLKWTSRIVVWTFLGPWMKAVDVYIHGLTLEEELKRKARRTTNELQSAFKLQCEAAKVMRENILKLKAFRVKLFGKYITKLPEYELSRHEDVPLPESSAEPYRGEAIEAKQFIPGQNLHGVMIPSTGEYNERSQESVSKERDTLIDQFHNLVTNQSAINDEDDISDEGFELVTNENQIVCVSSDVAENNSETRMTRDHSSVHDNIPQRSIQKMPESQIQKVHDAHRQTKSKWVFSASIHMSLTREPLQNDEAAALLENDSPDIMIDYDSPNEIEEEGVEVVPFLCEENEPSRDDQLASSDECVDDHVSVLYVKENEKAIADTD